MLLATQNPVELKGTFPLPEAQVDRFLLCLRMGYPAKDDEVRITEEREALGSLSEAAGAIVGGLGRRLRRRLSRLGRREAHSPAELVRLRYAQLEERLAAGGHVRPPGMTVRDFLASCAASIEAPVAVGDLAGLYELARYSAQAVAADQAERFEELMQGFGA